MKRRFILFNILTLCAILLSCSDGSSADIEYSSKYEGVYLKTVNGRRRVCYEGFDEENLRKKVTGWAEDDNINKLFSEDRYYFSRYGAYGRSPSSNTIRLDDYDLIRPWVGLDDVECLPTDLSFFDDGFLSVDARFSRKFAETVNAYHLATFEVPPAKARGF